MSVVCVTKQTMSSQTQFNTVAGRVGTRRSKRKTKTSGTRKKQVENGVKICSILANREIPSMLVAVAIILQLAQ